MNAVEIEEAVSKLAEAPFDREEFCYSFLEAFGNKSTTIARLRSGVSNSSDIPGGVLQRSNIHIAVCNEGETARALLDLKASPKTAAAKVRFVVATDGVTFEAEDLRSDDPPVICNFADFADHFGFFLPLAGISTVKQIRESAFDVRATGRLNKLYVELRKENHDWDTAERQHDMNHFMARLIFCFFAEDTGIFFGDSLFTDTLEKMSDPDGSNVHHVMETVFRALNMTFEVRAKAKLPRWAEAFPYVNGGLFAGSTEVPRFTKLARAFLISIGRLEWRKINPDIFGSMIQAVANDEERGALGMHYTSVPNILKVLNPLFLDDLRTKLAEADDNARMLLNLRKRMSSIRVFDPACGSGNFLVIAYKEMRAIEAEINKRRGEEGRKTDIPITNFRGIELLSFPTEIARLALIIAEYQCDELYRGQKEALQEFLPLDTDNWITCGNALRLDWLSICPPTGAGVKLQGDDLFSTPLDQAQIDFENEGGQTYICGNPPYIGGKKQSSEQKSDLARIFFGGQHKNLDFVCGFFLKAAKFISEVDKFAFVSTNSVNQGTHVPVLWPEVFRANCEIEFAYTPFRWSNNAAKNAGVSCTIIGIRRKRPSPKYIYDETSRRAVRNVSPYLLEGSDQIVQPESTPISQVSNMITGNAAYDGGHLFLDSKQASDLKRAYPELGKYIRVVSGTTEFIDGVLRYCLWLDDEQLDFAVGHPGIALKIQAVSNYRRMGGEVAKTLVSRPHQFRYRHQAEKTQILVPQVSSERREYLPVGYLNSEPVITHLAHAIYDPSLVDFSILSSKLHLVWISAVCGKLETRLRYASNLGWNTFPIPPPTEQNKADLKRCAENILLARETHFPMTIADLYDPDSMPADLREAHAQNDETLERIYIGRRFRNDTERLEKLFELYTKMTSNAPTVKSVRKKSRGA
jgi:hypothetical protein